LIVQESLDSRALHAMSDAVLGIASERGLDWVLDQLAEAARDLVQAKYTAIGVPDGEGGFEKFVTVGFTDKQFDAIGDLPRQHGMLGAMLEAAEPYRAADITEDGRFEGYPEAHPMMRTFLGVPIVSKDEVIGAFYLTEKRRREQFTDADQAIIETLAAHAAVAIENARLLERSRELTIVEERNRLARELHDAVNQTLFSVSLAADTAAMLVETDPGRAQAQMEGVRELARTAMEEMRSLIFELRPAELEAEGLVPTLRKHVQVLARIYGREIDLEVDGERALEPELEREIFRIAQEALGNALKHSEADRLAVRLHVDRRLVLAVSDNGAGFDPDGPRARRHLGLVSMRERAEALGGELTIVSASGEGTTVTLEADLDGRNSSSRR
jgi:signal transduction histidine kinase